MAPMTVIDYFQEYLETVQDSKLATALKKNYSEFKTKKLQEHGDSLLTVTQENLILFSKLLDKVAEILTPEDQENYRKAIDIIIDKLGYDPRIQGDQHE